jgi:hypothetical protein
MSTSTPASAQELPDTEPIDMAALIEESNA